MYLHNLYPSTTPNRSRKGSMKKCQLSTEQHCVYNRLSFNYLIECNKQSKLATSLRGVSRNQRNPPVYATDLGRQQRTMHFV